MARKKKGMQIDWFKLIGVEAKTVERRLYFAYGSNLNKVQMKRRCPYAVPVGRATLEGWTLQYRSVLTIDPKEGGKVQGAIWATTDDDERNLDAYEGWPFLYRKVAINVTLEDGGSAEVYVYIMNGDRRDLAPPSSYYLETCRQGARDWGIPDSVMIEPLEECMED